MRSQPSRCVRAAALLSLPVVLLAACTPSGPAPESGERADPSPVSGHHDHAEGATEQRSATPRLVVSYDGGVLVLDADTLAVVADEPVEGYLRLNELGDGRHVAVSTAAGFEVLDTGTWSEPHGDHAHHYTAAPGLTGIVYEADKAGHVVVHDGLTTLFDDGTGEIFWVPSGEAADPAADRDSASSDHAHHGVAVRSADGTLVSTLGDEESRTGLIARDATGRETARTEECPGVHGEAAARDALVFGCTDGVVVYSGGEFAKIDSPDAYGRIGNQSGSPVSHVVLGDYKVDEDAELERPTRVTLVDTVAASLRVVDLPASYSFRSLGRGPGGEALVLGTDGALHVIDPDSGELTRSIPVVDPWTESTTWQDPRPTLYVRGGTAYVTEPASQRILAVDLESGGVRAEAQLPRTPDELVAVSGGLPGGGA